MSVFIFPYALAFTTFLFFSLVIFAYTDKKKGVVRDVVEAGNVECDWSSVGGWFMLVRWIDQSEGRIDEGGRYEREATRRWSRIIRWTMSISVSCSIVSIPLQVFY
ncbi:MAG: hypothetical protein Alpg2KO_24940 [Alphaproteobacteria bacterium]